MEDCDRSDLKKWQTLVYANIGLDLRGRPIALQKLLSLEQIRIEIELKV